MRVESGDGDAGRARLAGFNDGADDVDGSTRVVKIIHDRCANVTLPPDVVSATLRSLLETIGRRFPATRDFGFRTRVDKGGDGSGVVHVAWAGGVTPGGEMTRDIGVPHASRALSGFGTERKRSSLSAEEGIFRRRRASPSRPYPPTTGRRYSRRPTRSRQICYRKSDSPHWDKRRPDRFARGGGGKPLFLRVLSISPRGSDPVARLAPNTELIVEPWSASAARSAGAATAQTTVWIWTIC